jgi:hypothetical protein
LVNAALVTRAKDEEGARPVYQFERDGPGRFARAKPSPTSFSGALQMRTLILSFAAFTAVCGAARAEGCFGPGEPLFHCTVKGGAKTVGLCLQGDAVYYHFGPTGGAPEMVLAQPVTEAFMRPWNGIGRTLSEEATLSNAGYSYTVYYAIDRLTTAEGVSGGVTVTRGDRTLADLSCDLGSVSRAQVYPLYESKEAAGQCWDRAAFQWGPC